MPKGPRKFHFSVESDGLTRFGGLVLFRQFCNTIGLRYFLQHGVRWPIYADRKYQPVDLFLTHVFAIVAGIGRIENTQSLVHNGLIPPILGLPNFPHRDTLRTFLWRFSSQTLQSLVAAHDAFRAELMRRFGLLYQAIVDADTTALITYGHQEGIALGYIPKRRHRKGSCAPILSSEGRTGLSLGMQLRSGNVHASTDAWPFLEAQLNKLPSTIAASRTRVRLDGAFYDREITLPLDEKGLGYVIVAPINQPLKRRMITARYHEFAQGWEAAQFTYTPFHWKEEHRFVAVRRPVAFEPEEAQQHLFTFQRYTYHRALVTSMDLTPEAVWRFYCDRAAQELLLREFKGSYHMAQIPTRSFWANATFMEMVLWAYDLVLAFQLLCLPEPVRHWNIATLRRELWWLPAEWIKRGNRNILRLPLRYPNYDLLQRVQNAVSKIKPLG